MPTTDQIILTGLRIPCIIGIFEWERKRKQDVVIDLQFPCDIGRAAGRDRIDDTVDYKKIAKAVIAFVGESKFQLVETLAERLADLLLREFHLGEVTLSVSKPGAIRGSQNVGIQIRRFAPPAPERGLAFWSLGSNIEPRLHLESALGDIQSRYPLAALSHVYESSPVGYASQPYFWNLVAAVETGDSPGTLRKWARGLEIKYGRRRTRNANGPRTLDLDLILWKDRVGDFRGFSLPHPDILTKAFVFFPLLEVRPNLMHPQKKKPLVELAAAFRSGTQKIRQLDADTFPRFPPRT